MASETLPLTDNPASEQGIVGDLPNGPGARPDRSRVSQALEAAIGTLREQLLLERERVGMADRRADLAERRADRAEAALAAELTRLDALRGRLAAAEAKASRLLAERDGADAFAQEAQQSANALRRAEQSRRDRNRRLGQLAAILIGAGLGAWIGTLLGDTIDGALIGGVCGGVLGALSPVSAAPRSASA